MPMHMVAFAKNGGFPGTGLQKVTPVPDQTITINGFQSYVPSKYNKIVYALGVDGSSQTDRVQLQSPSLRALWFPELTPLNSTTSITEYGGYGDWSQSPLPLETGEGLETIVDISNVAAYPLVVVQYADDKLTPVTGKIWTMRCTASVTLVDGEWVNAPMVFDQPLPVGDYDVVGMRVSGPSIVAARLVFIGQSAITRPGVFGQGSIFTANTPQFRYGYSGVFGTFNYLTPPSIEYLGLAGATNAIITLDLVQR